MSLIDAAFVVKDATVGVGNAFRETVVRVCLSCCTVIVLLWVAILMYISFYYAYMPTVHHSQPVFLQFSSDCRNDQSNDGLCSFPEANVSLSKGDRILMRGQRYQVYLDLEMPQSPVNEQLGMFMVTLKFMSHSGKVLATSSRSTILHFKSSFLKGIGTMIMSLPLILGFSEEKQVVAVKFFEHYVDDSYHPVTKINVVVSARRIEIYSASLRIEAEFSGFRYILFNYPITSALVCISTNFITACIIFFFAYHAFTPDPGAEPDTDAVEVTPDGQQHLYSEARRRDLRSRACRTPSPSPSHNTGRLTVKPAYSRSRIPENRVPPPQRPHSTHGRRLRSASFPQCRWDLQAEVGKDVGAATRGASSPSCRGRQDMHRNVQMADFASGNDGSGGARGVGRDCERRSQVTTLQPLTYSNTKKSDRRNTDSVNDPQTHNDIATNEIKLEERFDGVGTSSDGTKRVEPLDGVDRNKTSLSEARNDGINNAVTDNANDTPRGSHLEKSLSFDSGVQQILPAFTVLTSNRTTNKDATSTSRSLEQNSAQIHQGLYMRRIPDGAPAEPSHTQHSSLTRAKSEEHCSPRDGDLETSIRKRSPGKTKSKFGSSFRKMLPKR